MKPFSKGRKDFYAGNLENPFGGFGSSREWQRGFDSAFFAHLNRVKKKESSASKL